MQSGRNALVFTVITYRSRCQIRSWCHVLYNHAEDFRPFPQNSIRVSNFLQYNRIREGWTRWRESFWLPAFCLPNSLKRLTGRASKRKVIYTSHLKYKWLNSYPRNQRNHMKDRQSLIFRNAEGTHFLLLHLKLQMLIAPGKIDFRNHITTDDHIQSWWHGLKHSAGTFSAEYKLRINRNVITLTSSLKTCI